jgi:transcription antitermination factor NusG
MDLNHFGVCWFAIQVRARHEHICASLLRNKGYRDFLPLSLERGSNGLRGAVRYRITERPLYPGYVFCQFDPNVRAAIVTTPGVLRIVGTGTTAVSIPNAEIEAIRSVTCTGLPRYPVPYVRVGDQVKIVEGPLKGVTGILARVKGQNRFVLSIHLLQRSVAVEVNASWTEQAETDT